MPYKQVLFRSAAREKIARSKSRPATMIANGCRFITARTQQSIACIRQEMIPTRSFVYKAPSARLNCLRFNELTRTGAAKAHLSPSALGMS